MRLTLVNPNFQSRTRRVAQMTVGPPLGLAYLGATAREAGHEVRIVDGNALALDSSQAASRVAEQAPDVVGITATTPTIGLASQIAERVKTILPNVHVIVGGPHGTALPERTLREFTAFDIVARGESERSLPALLDALSSGGSGALEQVKGFAFW